MGGGGGGGYGMNQGEKWVALKCCLATIQAHHFKTGIQFFKLALKQPLSSPPLNPIPWREASSKFTRHNADILFFCPTSLKMPMMRASKKFAGVVMCDVWCVTCDVWCVMCDVWCVMCDVWCVMCDAWCVMYVWCVTHNMAI
jgi:hypothetical protein